MSTRSYEDFVVGEALALGSTVVDHDEMLAFAHRFDPQPFHTDPVAAKNSLLGGLCASGWFTASLWMRAWADEVLAGSTSQGSPGGREIAWPRPVFAGDELHFTADVLSARVSAKRPTLGLIEMTGRALRGGDPADEVLRLTFTGLFSTRRSDAMGH
ncbi:MaoC family dehydratase [Nakamurella sp. A5-74]|uniref:MaoC family dehydratase n=1 Tax=Nakamurella sp. A5-74 TaxID=3158264 RepID=A0AAU8DIT4_9ACTN